MTKSRIGVVRGGPSSEYEISLKTGSAILAALDPGKYEGVDIVVDKEGTWHIHGVPQEPREGIRKVDAIFNALHGAYGEDGKIQRILEVYGIPFTGSDSFGSAIGMNKALSKEYFRRAGLRIAPHILFEKEKIDEEMSKGQDPAMNAYRAVHAKFAPPYVVKPVSGGSSLGTTIVKSHEGFAEALAHAFMEGDTVLVEEFIPGIEASVGVIEDFRGSDLYALPAVEIRSKTGRFFDYEAKYAGGAEEIVPATFSSLIKAELERMAVVAHEIIGLRHYSRSDFIVHPYRGVFILETNTLPGLTPESLMPKALSAVGSSLGEFSGHLIELALA